MLTDTADFVGTDNGDGTLTVTYSPSYAGGTADTKATLLVEIEGYESVTKALTIGTVKTKPKLTVSPASSTVNTLKGEKSTSFQILDSKTKEAIELTADSVEASIDFAVYEVNEATDENTLTLTGTAGGTATLNMTSDFYRLCQLMTEEEERLLVYSIVNTLCTLPSVSAVRITIEGEIIESLAGSIYLTGGLLPNPGIIE